MAAFILAHLGKQSDAEVPPTEPEENKINAYVSWKNVDYPSEFGLTAVPNTDPQEYIIEDINGYYTEFSGDYDKIGWSTDPENPESGELVPNSFFSVTKAYENENDYAFVLHDNKWYLISPDMWKAIKSNGTDPVYNFFDWNAASYLYQTGNSVDSPTLVSGWLTMVFGTLATVEITL